MRFHNLTDWLAWLTTLHPKAIDMGLARVAAIATQLKLTPFPSKVITVAGTNGKGSCVAFLEAALLAAGYRVAAYTSPHLFTYNERLRIQGQQVTDAQLCEAFTQVDAIRGDISLTYFEFGTLAALLLMKQAQLDVAILEVGLGGRLDAVNVIDPDIAVITTVALDHMEWLGTDREAIGYEKAGIFRRDKPAVCGDFNVPDSVIAAAKELNATLFCQGKQFTYIKQDADFTWWNEQQRLDYLPLPKLELQNIATALQALALLSPEFIVKRVALEKALQSTVLPGRFQILQSPVLQIFDVAHNPAAATWLAKRLMTYLVAGKTRAIVAMLADKDREGTLAPLLSQVDIWYLADLVVPRGGSALSLQQFLPNHSNTKTYSTVKAAYRAALEDSVAGDRIIVFGSFYTVAQALSSVYNSSSLDLRNEVSFGY